MAGWLAVVRKAPSPLALCRSSPWSWSVQGRWLVMGVRGAERLSRAFSPLNCGAAGPGPMGRAEELAARWAWRGAGKRKRGVWGKVEL